MRVSDVSNVADCGFITQPDLAGWIGLYSPQYFGITPHSHLAVLGHRAVDLLLVLGRISRKVNCCKSVCDFLKLGTLKQIVCNGLLLGDRNRSPITLILMDCQMLVLGGDSVTQAI